ncbi:MAG: putative quinol monooxygenase [Victivallaceae bacterium]|nr:putative quinol monooxygenase [Victivallaceae bacterium]
MITVLASIRIKAGKMAEFLEIFKANVPTVCAEDGCVSYVPMVDIDSQLPVQEKDGNAVTVVEQWESLDALTAHLGAPHMLKYRNNVKALVDRVSLKILRNA